MRKKILVLGGGTGGLVAASYLKKQLGKSHDVTLIDKEKNHVFNPALLWLMMGLRTKQDIERPLAELEKKGILYFSEEVLGIDLSNQAILTAKQELNFDYLIIALGASQFPHRMKGFAQGAHDLYDINGVTQINRELENFQHKKITILISGIPFKCPAAPFEAALLLSSYFQKRKQDIAIEIITPQKLPMGVAGEHIGKAVVATLEEQGIGFLPEHHASEIDPQKKQIIFKDGQTRPYDFLIGIPPHGIPEALKGSPILAENGWVKVDNQNFETNIENVYAIGDVTTIPLAIGKPLPKAGVFAHSQAVVVASNIAGRIAGKKPSASFTGHGHCFLSIDTHRAAFASGNFYNKPKPAVSLRMPSIVWHWGKVLFEKWWLWKWFR